METFDTNYGKITLYSNETYITPAFRCRNGYWDIDTLLKLKQYIDPTRNILEIGGHCGTSSIVYASFLNNPCKVFVYEPQKNMCNLLYHNIMQNELQDKIIPYNYAVFCKQGYSQMNAIDLDGGGGLVSKRYNEEINYPCNFGGIGLGTNGEPVQMITVDDDMKHIENVGFIHCDAQGAENFIFSKATNFIKENRPVIFYENNEKYGGKYLFENVCNTFPDCIENSKFNLEDYCMNTLHYSNVIYEISAGNDLLIP